MARNKRRNDSGFSLRTVLLHPALLFLSATSVVIVGSIALWTQYKDQILDPSEFKLTSDSIRLTNPVPEWTRSDLRAMLLDQYQQPSSLDPSLVRNVADFVRSVGWVEQVNQIQKSKSGLEIDATFRQPVALVKTRDQQLLPIDRNGVLLDPNLIGSEYAMELMNVSMLRPIAPNASLRTWQPWPDGRVEGAAAISHALKEHWKSQGLFRVVTFQLPGDRAKREPYELWTYGHMRVNANENQPYAAKVIWGNPPGLEMADEADAISKIQAIDAFIVAKGPLKNSIPKGKMLDVRSGEPILTSKLRTAEQIRSFSELR